jgi:hypothetical protein
MAEINDNKIASSCQPYEDQEDSAQKQEAQSANDRLCLPGILADPSAQQTHGEQHTICGEADEIFDQLSHKATEGRSQLETSRFHKSPLENRDSDQRTRRIRQVKRNQ